MRKRLAVVSAAVGALAVGGLLTVAPPASASTGASSAASGCTTIPLILPGWHITICL
jgi:hypothetical protein